MVCTSLIQEVNCMNRKTFNDLCILELLFQGINFKGYGLEKKGIRVAIYVNEINEYEVKL